MTKENLSASKYTEAGVDIDKGNAFVSRIKQIVRSTHSRTVIDDIGGFSGLFSIGNSNCKDPVLVASTDGVGTKLKIAQLCNKHDTIGIDLVAMCVNDVIVCGAKPLFFLDYFATASLNLEVATDVVAGIAEGCKRAGCSLIGGETAEMPGMYQAGDYDLAGFSVGICDREAIIDGCNIRVGNKIIGLASSGLHSNGYSLVRKVIFEELDLKVSDYCPELGCTVGEELLRPTRIYAESVGRVVRNFPVNGMVHNTGGGFIDNIPRILPKGCKARIQQGSWPVPPIFRFLEEKGKIAAEEMFRTFNMGIGLMLIVNEVQHEAIMDQLTALGERPYIIGDIQAVKGAEELVSLSNL